MGCPPLPPSPLPPPPNWRPRRCPAPVKTVQVGIAEDVYAALTAAAQKQGTTPEALATEAIRKHLGL